MQVTCWLLLAAVLLLVPLFNFFGGLALLHGYLAAGGRTSYEICKGAQVHCDFIYFRWFWLGLRVYFL